MFSRIWLTECTTIQLPVLYKKTYLNATTRLMTHIYFIWIERYRSQGTISFCEYCWSAIITPPTSHTLVVAHGGSCLLNGHLLLLNVLFVLQFQNNLIYVSQLCQNLSCFVYFHPDSVTFQSLSNRRTTGTSKIMEDYTCCNTLVPILVGHWQQQQLFHDVW